MGLGRINGLHESSTIVGNATVGDVDLSRGVTLIEHVCCRCLSIFPIVSLFREINFENDDLVWSHLIRC